MKPLKPTSLAILRQMCLFGLVGVANTLLDIAAFAVLTHAFHVWAIAANVISFSLGAASSYMLNRRVTFRIPNAGRGRLAEITRFALVTVATLSASTASLAALIPTLGVMPAKFASVLVSFGFGYLLQRRLVFSE